MKMRPADWPSRLDLFLQEKRSMPFKWGENDCCLFASDWIAIISGIDPAESLRGYVSPLAALRIVKRMGGVEKITRDICSLHGWPEVPIPLARRGDIVAAQSKHGPAIGVSCGHVAAFPVGNGIAFRRLAECQSAWRIL